MWTKNICVLGIYKLPILGRIRITVKKGIGCLGTSIVAVVACVIVPVLIPVLFAGVFSWWIINKSKLSPKVKKVVIVIVCISSFLIPYSVERGESFSTADVATYVGETTTATNENGEITTTKQIAAESKTETQATNTETKSAVINSSSATSYKSITSAATSKATKSTTVAATRTTTRATTRTTTRATTRTTTRTTTRSATTADTSRTVYITPTGKRYHYSKACAGKNANQTTLNKAKKNYGPCGVCVN